MAKFLGPWALYFYALHVSEAIFPGCYRIKIGGWKVDGITIGQRQVDGRYPPPHIIVKILKFLNIADLYSLKEAYRNWGYYDNQLEVLDDFLPKKWSETLRSPTKVIHVVNQMRSLSPEFGSYRRKPSFHDGFFELDAGGDAHSSTEAQNGDDARYRFVKRQVPPPVETQDVDDARVRMYIPDANMVDELVKMAYMKMFPNALHLVAKMAGREINLATMYYDINCHIWHGVDSPTVHAELVGTLPLRVKFNKPIRPHYRGAVHDALDWNELEKLWFYDSLHPTSGKKFEISNIEPAELMTVDVLALSRQKYSFFVGKYREDGLPPEWFYGEVTPFYQQQAYINRVRWKLKDYGRMMQ